MKENISVSENPQGKESKKIEISKKSNLDGSSSSGGAAKM